MTTFKIKATAPTVYQINSLRSFGMEIKENGDGSYSSEQIFDTEQEAKDYLTKRAEKYYDEYEGQVDEHLESIRDNGYLTIDAATAIIDVEIDPENL